MTENRSMDLAGFVSSEKLFGFSSLSMQNDIETLQESYKEAKKIESDIRLIKDDIDLDIHEGTKPVYCTDFDVIASAMDWKDVSSQNSYWSSLIFHFEKLALFLLPGTLFEISRHNRKKMWDIQKLNPFGQALLSAILKNMVDAEKTNLANEQLNDLLSKFKSGLLNPREMYILNMIQKKLDTPENHKFPAIDQDLLYYSIYFLSSGARVNKSINNRVDAINYTICHALSNERKSLGFRYVLVSDTTAVHKLSSTFERGSSLTAGTYSYDQGFVRSSRATALALLVRKIGITDSGAERLCYNLLADLAQYIRKINDLISLKRNRPKAISDDKHFKGQNPLVNLVSSIENLQAELEKEKIRSNKFQLSFNDNNFGTNPADFYLSFEKQIDNILKKSTFKKVFDSMEIKEAKSLKATTTNKSGLFTFLEERTIKDDFDEVVAVARDYENYTQYIYSADIPFPQFISIYNSLSSKISSEIAGGRYSEDLWSSNNDVLTGISSKTSDRRVVKIESKTNFTLVEISEALGMYPAEICLLRFDNPVFSFSHEEGLIVLSSQYNISGEIALLLDRLTSSRIGVEGASQIAAHLDNKKNRLELPFTVN